MTIIDCRFDVACVEKSVDPGALILSQSEAGVTPYLRRHAYVLDYTILQESLKNGESGSAGGEHQ